MLHNVRKLRKESHGAAAAGFTIIEVMIVLAVAGIIMAIVFLAIPTLQRNNRNTQRKNDASRLAGLIADYATNNNGALPTAFGTSATQLDVSGEKWSIMTAPTGNIPTSWTAPAAGAMTADQFYVYAKATCSSNVPVAGTSNRQFAVYYRIEGATTTQCIES